MATSRRARQRRRRRTRPLLREARLGSRRKIGHSRDRLVAICITMRCCQIELVSPVEERGTTRRSSAQPSDFATAKCSLFAGSLSRSPSPRLSIMETPKYDTLAVEQHWQQQGHSIDTALLPFPEHPTAQQYLNALKVREAFANLFLGDEPFFKRPTNKFALEQRRNVIEAYCQ